MLKKILISGFMIFAVPAFAVTLEFDDAQSGPGPFQDPGTFFESGFTVNGYYFDTPGMIHLDDTGPFSDSIDITGPKRFHAFKLRIQGMQIPTWYMIDDAANTLEYIVYPNVLVQGVRDGSVVAETRFTANNGELRYNLSSEFRHLDSLIISARGPDDPALVNYFSAFEANLDALYPGLPYERGCNDPCSHFDVDSVEVTPTPIPGALVLMLSAALGGGVARRLISKRRISLA